MRQGEHAYHITLPKNNVAIEVRSSVRENNQSAATGKDSIRCWLIDSVTGQPMGSKITRWTTRLPGWGDRTKEVIRQLWTMGSKIVPCPTCKCQDANVDSRLRCFKVKKDGPNKGRLFLRCNIEGCRHFEWLDEEEEAEVKATTVAVKEVEVDETPPLKGLNTTTESFVVEVPKGMKEELAKLVEKMGGKLLF
jgi:hypothetical protein